MLLGLDASLWKSLLVILVCPVIVVGLLNVLLRKRGGISPGWGGVLIVLMAGLVSMLIILDKVHL